MGHRELYRVNKRIIYTSPFTPYSENQRYSRKDGKMSFVDKNPSASAQERSVASMDEAQLATYLQQLQDDISNSMHQNRPRGDLREKKLSYNQVMNILYERQPGPRLDPMDILPNEILTEILVMSSEDPPFHFLRLTLVSRKWGNFMLSEPGLWNHIRLFNYCDESILVILGNNRSRVNTISIRPGVDSQYSDGGKYHEDVREFLDDLGILPNLQRLTISPTNRDESSYDLQELLNRYPSLKYLTKMNVNMETLTFIVTVLHHLKCLDYVYISYGMNKNDMISFESALSPNLNVRELDVYIHEYDVPGLNPRPVRSEEETTEQIDMIITMLLQLMPRTDELSIGLSFEWSSIPLFGLESRFSGTKLSLIFSKDCIGDLEAISIPSSTLQL
ncbi:2463_t:CDS:2, partial [Acaulospora colombiana]